METEERPAPQQLGAVPGALEKLDNRAAASAYFALWPLAQNPVPPEFDADAPGNEIPTDVLAWGARAAWR